MPRHDPATRLFRTSTTTLRTLALAAALALAGCATGPASTPSTSPGTGPAGTPSEVDAAASLATERQWLQQWFKGTPVEIGQRRDGPVTIEVPREFSFDAGKAVVKPALGAVLDKVAESLRRAPALRLALLAAPGDANGDAALSLKRAAALRAHLVGRGVPALQLALPEAALQPSVQLRLEASAAR